ncbi:glutaredoxin domain-containing protein [Marinobacter lacisalsi]|uniref:Glutaredoxin domain-containing protein n=1 Tax=Marinobacter lacisalsi TaxID=475979 RepID=A0ABV8QBL7_9GAMM
MKKMVFIALAALVFQQWGNINEFFNPPPDYAAAHGGKVILYATDWCGYCEKTRQYLTSSDIPYHEYDIEKSEEGKRQFDALGGSGVPVLLVNGDVIKGYDPARINESLD